MKTSDSSDVIQGDEQCRDGHYRAKQDLRTKTVTSILQHRGLALLSGQTVIHDVLDHCNSIYLKRFECAMLATATLTPPPGWQELPRDQLGLTTMVAT